MADTPRTRRALVLAAGRGERMRPLTLSTPKPLLRVGGRALIEWHLAALARAGIDEVVVNVSHLRGQFAPALGDGSRFGLSIRYSDEGPEPLETGGGMLHARAALGEMPFVLVNGDVWADLDFASLPAEPPGLAHLVLVANPPQHPAGDFWLAPDGRVYRAALLDDWRKVIGETPGAAAVPPRFPLAPLLRAAMARGRVTGQRHDGAWRDIGTPERLAELDAALRARAASAD